MQTVYRVPQLALALTGIAFLCAAQPAEPTFKVVISSELATVRTGAELTVKVVLTNTSDHRITVLTDRGMATELSDYRIQVRDSQGRIQRTSRYYWSVGQSGMARVPEGSERDYSDNRREGPGAFDFWRPNPAPGETVETSFDVNKLYAKLPPGKYTIQVERIDEETKAVVKSNILNIDVTE